MRLDIGSREKNGYGSHSWKIHSDAANQSVETIYEFLRWDDIIRANWARNEIVILLRYFWATWVYLTSGALRKVFKAAWPPFVASLLPLVFLLLVLAAAVGAGWGVNQLALASGGRGWLGSLLGLVGFGLVIHAGRLMEKRINCYWLLRIFSFTVRQGRDSLPELDARLDQFARRIVEQMRASEDDEVLIVGHSTGTMIAVSAVARALQIDPQIANGSARLSLMTLGHCIPILSLLPQAERFRQELAVLANTENLDWVDFTAPTDGACFAFVDPIDLSGIVRHNAREPKPKLLSPRFAALFTPATYARIKRDWYRNHFQYLMAGEKVGDYDYFAITAGQLTLADRFRSKASVKNFTGLKIRK